MVSLFAFGISLLAFYSRTCICYGFLFEVSLQLYFGCMATYGPRYERGVGVDGTIVGLVAVFCCVGILSHL